LMSEDPMNGAAKTPFWTAGPHGLRVDSRSKH